jgi:hypothetical protein
VSFAASDSGATLLVTTPFRERSFSLVVDVVRPRLWTRELQDAHRFPLDRGSRRRWSMAAPTPGNGLSVDPFARAEAFVEYACADLVEFAPAAALARVRHETGQVLRGLARHALSRCDPRALTLARRLHPEGRFFAYARIVRDRSGRVGQLVSTCPGLLLFCAAEAHLERGAVVDAVLARVTRGEALPRVIRAAVEAVTDLRSAWDYELENAVAATGRERYLRRAALLVRRAGPAVNPGWVTAAAPMAFAPEDIPRHPGRNAQWYGVMAASWRELAACAPDVAASVATFTSRHASAVAGAARRLRAARADDVWDGSSSGAERIVSTLAIYAGETGHRPRRCSNAVRYVATARRWLLRERHGGAPVFRVGQLIERLRALDLGPVVGVRFLDDGVDLSDADARLPFPEWPWGKLAVEGVSVRHLSSAAELAEEGREMSHCAAMALADAIAGELILFSVRLPGSRLTLALEPRPDGTYLLHDLRGVSDREPLAREREAVEGWLGKLNACAAHPAAHR